MSWLITAVCPRQPEYAGSPPFWTLELMKTLVSKYVVSLLVTMAQKIFRRRKISCGILRNWAVLVQSSPRQESKARVAASSSTVSVEHCGGRSIFVVVLLVLLLLCGLSYLQQDEPFLRLYADFIQGLPFPCHFLPTTFHWVSVIYRAAIWSVAVSCLAHCWPSGLAFFCIKGGVACVIHKSNHNLDLFDCISF